MFCSNCGKEILGNAQFCSSCGAPASPPAAHLQTAATKEHPPAPKKKSGCLTVIGVLVALFIAIGILAALFGDDGTSPASGQMASITDSTPDLEYLGDAKVVSDDFNRYITGTVKNNSKREYEYVQIEFNLYDKFGTQIGSTFDNLNNLEPGGTWKFKAMILEDEAASFKYKNITKADF
ncbi:MAG: FxLYD domain-containing protein [Bacteroidota bacterium]